MAASLWFEMHGATVHFPLALTVCAAMCDAGGLFAGGRPAARSLHGAARWSILLGAGVSVLAVASGLLLTHGTMLGKDLVLRHHAMVWPAFALLVGVATWRLFVGERPRGPAMLACTLVEVVAAALMIGAGYWGGQMLGVA
jgi:uncharacterized membrane protein